MRHVRATGTYAVYQGNTYLVGSSKPGQVGLIAEGTPIPKGPARNANQYEMEWLSLPTSTVDRDDIDRTIEVKTTCRWQGEPFDVWVVSGDDAYLQYRGSNVDKVLRYPEMHAALGRAEGLVPLRELTDVVERETITVQRHQFPADAASGQPEPEHGTLVAAMAHCVQDPDASTATTWKAFRAAHEVSSALSTTSDSTDAGNWLTAFWLAVICRDHHSMTALAHVPLRLIDDSGTDDYSRAWIDTLQTWWLRSGDVEAKLAATSSAHTTPDSPSTSVPTTSPSA